MLRVDRRPAGAHRRRVSTRSPASSSPPPAVLRLRSARARGLHASTRRRRAARRSSRSARETGPHHRPDRVRLVAPTARFVVADAPQRPASASRSSRAAGSRSAASRCRAARSRASCSSNIVLNGIGSLQYTGRSILISQPETGALVTEYSSSTATPHRTFGELRPTGHEARSRRAPRAEHRAAARRSRPAASTSCSSPACRCSGSTTRRARCCSSATSKGREIDEYLRDACRRRGRRGAPSDGECCRSCRRPSAPPASTATGELWISLTSPYHLRLRPRRRQGAHGAVPGRRRRSRRTACSSRRTAASSSRRAATSSACPDYARPPITIRTLRAFVIGWSCRAVRMRRWRRRKRSAGRRSRPARSG